MDDLIGMGTISTYLGVILMVHLIFGIVSALRRRNEARRAAERRQLAEELLTSCGYVACDYFPGLGVGDDSLRDACVVASGGGRRLVFTQEGALAGKVASNIPCERRKTGRGGPRLRLVVSNPPPGDQI